MISYSNNEYTTWNTGYVEAVGSANFGCTAYTVHASAIASKLALLSASAYICHVRLRLSHMLIRITAAVLTCCAVMSCVDDSAVVTELDWAEAVMEAHPDSALALLDTLDRSRLRTRGAKARHALLYSQALDKNWIDLSTDSIIKPAVRYYARHGSPDDRLKAQYYLGRIYQNAGDNESAMRCFVNAEGYASKCDDAVMAGRLYTAMTAIYYSVYQFESALSASVNAAESYLEAADTNWYADKMISSANICLILKDTIRARQYLNDARQVFPHISEETKGYYFGEYLNTLPKDSVRLI